MFFAFDGHGDLSPLLTSFFLNFHNKNIVIGSVFWNMQVMKIFEAYEIFTKRIIEKFINLQATFKLYPISIVLVSPP